MKFAAPYTIYLRTLPSGRKVWYYQFRTSNGKRTGRSCGTSNKAKALRYVRGLYETGRLVQSGALSFGDFAAAFFDEGGDYLAWRDVNGNRPSPSTLASYRRLLEHQLLPFFSGFRLDAITAAAVKDWVVWVRGKCSAKTSNNAQSVLNIILKSAYERALIGSVPCAGMAFRRVERKERVLLSPEELGKIWRGNWGWESARLAFLVCAVTGMRIGEVTGLLSCNVGEDRINVEHSLHPKFGLGPTKTRARRWVPVPPSLGLKEKCGSVWAFQKPDAEEPVPAIVIYKRMMRICAAAGIDAKARGITVHSLRNAFISYMRGSPEGAAIDLKIKAVVGHADPSMTGWYTYWKPEMFPEIYRLQEQLLREITGM